MTLISQTRHSIGLISPKGGQGVTTTACGLAIAMSRSMPVTLVGSATTAAALGVATSSTTFQVNDNLRFTSVLPEDQPFVDIDVSDLHPNSIAVIDGMRAAVTYMVVRPCYLALRRAVSMEKPDGIIVIREPGRALTSGDIERAIGAPVVAELVADPAVAMAVDAGLLSTKGPMRAHDALKNLAQQHGSVWA